MQVENWNRERICVFIQQPSAMSMRGWSGGDMIESEWIALDGLRAVR